MLASIIMASMNVVEQVRESGVRALALRGVVEAFQQNAPSMSVENLNALAALMHSFGATDPAQDPDTPSDTGEQDRQQRRAG
jgi:hypothetical protein